LCWLLVLLNSTAFAITRENVLIDAAAYRAFPWKPETKNILDSYNLFRDSYVPLASLQVSTDGIDDRFFEWNDKATPPRWEYSKSNWPFEVCSTCTYRGEVYTWGGWKGNLKWGADTTGEFYDRLHDTSDKWIAGGRKGIEIPVSGETKVPAGYRGYAGIDCSGFVGNALDINKFAADKYKFNSTQLIGNSVRISTSDVKLGDFVGRDGDHVALFVEWIDAPRTARIIHASYKHFSEGDYKYRVVWDSATLTGNITVPGTLPAGEWQGNGVRSLLLTF